MDNVEMILAKIIDRVDRFLFRKIDNAQFALLRICIGILILIYLIRLFAHASVHFSQSGWLSKSDIGVYNAGSWSLLFLAENIRQMEIFFVLAVVSACAFTVGCFTKFFGWVTWVALVSLWNKNPLILDGDDALLRISLFFILLSPCGRAISFDQYLRGSTPIESEIWPLRMIQFQLAIVYFLSGWVKFHSAEWLDGTVLGYVLIHPDYAKWNLVSLLMWPWVRELLRIMAFVVRWWELLFPLLIVFSKTRTMALMVGIGFHLSLLVFMNLRFFCWIMLVLYIAFIPNRFFRRIQSDDVV